MSILVDENTKVIVQGTGRAGKFHAEHCMAYPENNGTNIVGGVKPGAGGGKFVADTPMFNTVKEAVAETGANASLIFVPAPFAADAILEANDAGVELIICITEGIPVLDMARVHVELSKTSSRLIGPNCPGIISPGKCKLGIMPGYIHKPGPVGVLSRSGTLTYEAVHQLTQLGIGQSTCIGIGGDPIIGTPFIDALELYEKDPDTKAVVMIGEIGGSAEELAAAWIEKNMTKPVVSFIAGQTAPKGKRMGHAGAIISGGKGTAKEKMEALEAHGISVSKSPSDIGETVKKVMTEKGLL